MKGLYQKLSQGRIGNAIRAGLVGLALAGCDYQRYSYSAQPTQNKQSREVREYATKTSEKDYEEFRKRSITKVPEGQNLGNLDPSYDWSRGIRNRLKIKDASNLTEEEIDRIFLREQTTLDESLEKKDNKYKVTLYTVSYYAFISGKTDKGENFEHPFQVLSIRHYLDLFSALNFARKIPKDVSDKSALLKTIEYMKTDGVKTEILPYNSRCSVANLNGELITRLSLKNNEQVNLAVDNYLKSEGSKGFRKDLDISISVRDVHFHNPLKLLIDAFTAGCMVQELNKNFPDSEKKLETKVHQVSPSGNPEKPLQEPVAPAP